MFFKKYYTQEEIDQKIKEIVEHLEQYRSELRELQRKGCKTIAEDMPGVIKSKHPIHLQTHEVADILEITEDKVRRYADAGLLKFKRSKGNHRRFDKQYILSINYDAFKKKIDSHDRRRK